MTWSSIIKAKQLNYRGLGLVGQEKCYFGFKTNMFVVYGGSDTNKKILWNLLPGTAKLKATYNTDDEYQEFYTDEFDYRSRTNITDINEVKSVVVDWIRNIRNSCSYEVHIWNLSQNENEYYFRVQRVFD